jgi:nitroimidazol reductase NimA-like FMN-containing flavoprotein (pyridoxamine 5'-phosphate oxidase superfamily)
MVITELTRPACLELLTRAHLGRLACAQGNQPYVVPFYFVYYNDCLYSFSTVGQKIEWMRANPLVCAQTDEIVDQEQWKSVVAFGRYEEIPDTPQWAIERGTATALLEKTAVWWEPGSAKTILKSGERSQVTVLFRIQLTHITGHVASR